MNAYFKRQNSAKRKEVRGIQEKNNGENLRGGRYEAECRRGSDGMPIILKKLQGKAFKEKVQSDISRIFEGKASLNHRGQANCIMGRRQGQHKITSNNHSNVTVGISHGSVRRMVGGRKHTGKWTLRTCNVV